MNKLVVRSQNSRIDKSDGCIMHSILILAYLIMRNITNTASTVNFLFQTY